jgi:RimJ/RimL family protein N-acetyltransferase
MYLRKYVETDAEKILSWIADERAFRLWSAGRYGEYPITSDEINQNYRECDKSGGFYPVTLIDEEENVIGHLILRNPTEDKSIIRLGFIIVDNKVRGKGYGKKLLELAIRYAREELLAEEINLGVFKVNESAYKCYTSVGLRK